LISNLSQITAIIAFTGLMLSCNPKQLSENKTPSIESNINSKSASIENELKLSFTSVINSIFQDSKGHYWFGSNKEGGCLYDGKSLKYFTMEDGLVDNNIFTIQEDEIGNIWFGTESGISSYDGTQFKTHTSPNFKDKTKFGFHSVNKKSDGDWGIKASDLWFNGGDGIGVHRLSDQQLNFLAFPTHNNNPNNPDIVTDIARGRNNKIWIATYAGVFGYDGDSFTILNEENLNITKEQVHIRAVFEDSKNRLWIGNNSIGVLLYNENTIINFSEQNGLSNENIMTNNIFKNQDKLEHVFAIEEDKNGNIWFGDRDTGAWKYDGNSIINFKIEDGLSSNFVRTIYRDHKDELWFGLANGHVFKFNGKSFDKQF